jgi:hypothetical protein
MKDGMTRAVTGVVALMVMIVVVVVEDAATGAEDASKIPMKEVWIGLHQIGEVVLMKIMMIMQVRAEADHEKPGNHHRAAVIVEASAYQAMDEELQQAEAPVVQVGVPELQMEGK